MDRVRTTVGLVGALLASGTNIRGSKVEARGSAVDDCAEGLDPVIIACRMPSQVISRNDTGVCQCFQGMS